MTGTSDVPEEENDKVTTAANQLEAIDQVVARPAKTDLTSSANSEFGTEKSAPITWDNIVHGNPQDTKVAEINESKADTFKNQVESFVQTLNAIGITSISWQCSVNKGEGQRTGGVETFVLLDDNDKDDDDVAQFHRRLRSTGGTSNSSPTAPVPPAKPFIPSQKRFILGSEIALAVVIAAAGATRLRAGIQKSRPRAELIPGDNTSDASHTAKMTLELTNAVVSSEEKSLIETDKVSEQKSGSNTQKIVRPKTLVASTDTLASIAEAFFYDRNVAWLIADINHAILKETWMDGKRIVELKSRQQIELPLKEDIERFYAGRPEHARAENLVTIVEETSVNAELLNNSLGGLLDSKHE